MNNQQMLEQIIKEQNEDWWLAGKEDNYDVIKKLTRVGCRPIQRKYIQCLQINFDEPTQCHMDKSDLSKCLEVLQYLQVKEMETQQKLKSKI